MDREHRGDVRRGEINGLAGCHRAKCRGWGAPSSQALMHYSVRTHLSCRQRSHTWHARRHPACASGTAHLQRKNSQTNQLHKPRESLD